MSEYRAGEPMGMTLAHFPNLALKVLIITVWMRFTFCDLSLFSRSSIKASLSETKFILILFLMILFTSGASLYLVVSIATTRELQT